MSYENTQCPCGGVKEPGTMLCQNCLADLAAHPCMTTFNDFTKPLDLRSHAAVVLCSLARGLRRNRKLRAQIDRQLADAVRRTLSKTKTKKPKS